MKTIIRIASAAAICLAALLGTSCVQEMKDQQMPEFITGITVTGEDVDFSEFETMVNYDASLRFSWSPSGDELGIFPIGSYQQYFPLSDVGSGASAKFDGGAWSLKSTYEYAAYYPFSEDYYHVKDMRIPVSYVGQRQVGNNSTANLGEFSYMVSEATKPDAKGSVDLAMKNVGAVLRLAASIPSGVTVTSATLTDNTSDFIVGGKVDLSSKHSGSAAFVPEIVEPVYASSISIAVEDLVTEEAAEGQPNVILFCWLAPQDLTGHELELNLSDDSGNSYCCETAYGKTLNAGKAVSLDFGVYHTSADSMPLRFIAKEDGASIGLTKYGDDWDAPVLEYSTDGVNWNEYIYGNTISLPKAGDLVYFRGDNDHFSVSESNYMQFRMNRNIAAKGSIMYLLDKNGADKPMNGYCFYCLFHGCTSLTTAPELPAETLAPYCYWCMFKGCTSLTTAPALPAESLNYYCYWCMFEGCTSLTTAPELPAETLADYCYDAMFEGCTSLTTAPELPATTLKYQCYFKMFRGCTSLTTAPALPAESLNYYCYYSMFSGCTSLTTAPDLPATTLKYQCYYSMFYGCTSLTTAPELPAETLAPYCYWGMFYGCTSLTTAPELPATILADWCYYSMFSGCTSLTTAPELPAETLAPYCYRSMFSGCTSLTNAPELPAKSLASFSYYRMFKDCPLIAEVNACFTSFESNSLTDWLTGTSVTGTFYKNPNATWTREEAEIPEGWTLVDAE